MNKDVIVVYKSNYGTTKQYAEWISEALMCECIDVSRLGNVELSSYSVVVYGGGLYASGIAGLKSLAIHEIQHLVLFTVGLANPELTDYSKIMSENEKYIHAHTVTEFHLRGGIDYSKLKFIHRTAMAMMKKMSVDKVKKSEITEENKAFLETYGGSVSFVEKDTIRPIVTYVQEYSK